MRLICIITISLAVSSQCWGAGFGSVEGKFILEGELPEIAPLIRQGDVAAKDSAVCAASDIPNDARVFDPQSKGIGNIFVYLKSAPSEVHPSLKSSPVREVEFEQKRCRFVPHGLIIRTDQVVVCRSDDILAHNVAMSSPANPGTTSIIVPPKDRKGISIGALNAESRPVKIQCDVHPWMIAYWMIVDHPYATITDKDGRFKIENLPVGEHEFRVWHEDVGYIDRKLIVEIKDGQTIKLPVKAVPLTSFKN